MSTPHGLNASHAADSGSLTKDCPIIADGHYATMLACSVTFFVRLAFHCQTCREFAWKESNDGVGDCLETDNLDGRNCGRGSGGDFGLPSLKNGYSITKDRESQS